MSSTATQWSHLIGDSDLNKRSKRRGIHYYDERLLARAERHQRYGAARCIREGHPTRVRAARARQVGIEFPDYASAQACYHDPEYEAAHTLRIGATVGDVIIVEGYDGPQPIALAPASAQVQQ